MVSVSSSTDSSPAGSRTLRQEYGVPSGVSGDGGATAAASGESEQESSVGAPGFFPEDCGGMEGGCGEQRVVGTVSDDSEAVPHPSDENGEGTVRFTATR